MSWVLRGYEPTDEGFVYDDILESVCRSPAGRAQGWDVFDSPPRMQAREEHRKLIAHWLGTAACIVAADAVAPKVIAAYAILEREEPVVHWFAVKRALWNYAAELAEDILGPVREEHRVLRSTMLIPDLKRLVDAGNLKWRVVPDPTYAWRKALA